MIFRTKFAENGYFLSKTGKLNITIEFYLFQLVQIPSFTLNKQFWILGTKLPPCPPPPKKMYFRLKTEKVNTPLLKSFMTEISVIQKPIHGFALQINEPVSIWCRPPSWKVKLISLIIWTKLAQKGYFCSRSKTENVKITIGFCMFESTFSQGYHVLSVTFTGCFCLFSKTFPDNSILW